MSLWRWTAAVVAATVSFGATARASEAAAYTHLVGSARFGAGARFSDPTGAYGGAPAPLPAQLRLGGAALYGAPDGLQLGPALAVETALVEVPQWVVLPGALLLYRGGEWSPFAELGVPLALSPDRALGGELALGVAWTPFARVGLVAVLAGALFAGGDRGASAVPVVAGQLGFWFDWELIR